MANEFRGLAAHSAEYFGDTRDHWWNADFIEMIGRRWEADRLQRVLDVGCGVGHWGRTLARILPETATLIGVDREPRWVEQASERAAAADLGSRFGYRQAAAEALPFEDGTFDLVTCQTLLIHVADPTRVVSEMIRVARPGGLVATAEPTNGAALLLDAIALGEPPDAAGRLAQFQLVCEHGKRILGEGDNLLGEALPGLFARLGLEAIEVRQNDSCWSMVPPYSSAFEAAQAEEAQDAVARDIGLWDEPTTRRYFLAGGGQARDFTQSWDAVLALRRRTAAAIRANRYSRAGGGPFYLVWGRRPAAPPGATASR
jgi:SAM-dependent methyltransferase